MSVVLDASATLALIYAEIAASDLGRLEEEIAQSGAIVPQLWRLEIANILLLNCRRGRHDLEAVKNYFLDLTRSRIAIDEETGKRAWSSALELAAKHGLTSYDAAYLELALRMRAPLATLDRDLIRAARDEGVQLFWA